MRLRQAHAILQTVTALEASELEFDFSVFDHDHEYAVDPPEYDYVAGLVEFVGADGEPSREYHVDIKPGPGDRHIAVFLSYGNGLDAPCLWREEADVSQLPGTDLALVFREDVGAALAVGIVGAVLAKEESVAGENGIRDT
ncbi:hypothetical protein ACFVYG_32675 [Streptomyces sp. NPDC058256]|uniref:hypothetical protein n=1 Tax=Streptomyces sp. NPDC058256 TaxID=3346408 RepID=UPI0036E27AC3